jgi:hypothetical protein
LLILGATELPLIGASFYDSRPAVAMPKSSNHAQFFAKKRLGFMGPHPLTPAAAVPTVFAT